MIKISVVDRFINRRTAPSRLLHRKGYMPSCMRMRRRIDTRAKVPRPDNHGLNPPLVEFSSGLGDATNVFKESLRKPGLQ